MQRFFAQCGLVQSLECGVDRGHRLADVGHQSGTVPGEILDTGLPLALDGRTWLQSLPEVGIRRDNNVNEAVAEQSRAPDDEFGGGGKYHLVPHFQFHRNSLHGR